MRSALPLALLLVACASVEGQAPRPLNVVLITVDDLGWRDPACYGNDFHDTPWIDRLAREGMLFTQAYANAPNCAPSRACLFSGQYAPRHGVYTVAPSDRGRARDRRLIPIPTERDLPDDSVTLAEALRDAGYATAHFGKWHLGSDPRTQGYDVNVGGNRAGHPKSYFAPWSNPDLPDGPEGEFLTDRLADEALRFVDAHRGGPFFLDFSPYAVHTPIQPKAELRDKYRSKRGERKRNAAYAALVESTDSAIGRLLEHLERTGLARDTLVIFFSDNGGHGAVTSMAPLRGSKGMLYEGGVRVPMIVRWPGRVAPGSRCEVPVIGTDLYPTVLAACGLAPPAGVELDGQELTGLLAGARELEREALYWHFPAYLEHYDRSQGPWRTTPAGAIRVGDLKLIESFEDGRLELYDLARDLGETHDLAAERPERTLELQRALAAWRERVGAPVPAEPEPAFVESAD